MESSAGNKSSEATSEPAGSKDKPLLEPSGELQLAFDVSPPEVSGEVGQTNHVNDVSVSQSDDLCKRNIRMMFVFQVVNSLTWGIAYGSIFDKYLYYLGGDHARGPTLTPPHRKNSLVGFSESISGLAGLALAVPIGMLVDKHPERRARLLKLSTIFAVLATTLFVVACLSDIVLLLYVALIVLGVFAELSGSASEAIFADSIPKGSRSGLFTTKSILGTVSGAVGPFLSGMLLEMLGDTWQPNQMKLLLVLGSLFLPGSCIALMFFQDPPINGDDGESGDSSATDGAPESIVLQRNCGVCRSKHVPVIIAISDFLTCVGAGMTVKFFNLFFIEDMHFTPSQISWLNAAYPLAIAIFMKGTEQLAKPLGRAQASLLFFSMSVLCLVLLSQLYSLPLLLAVYLVRGAFANSTYPIDRSILMDFTPSSQRGMWNAVESLTSITWSGSAFIGGLLSDAHDYRFTFLLTAMVYGLGCICYSPLLVLVPRREADSRNVPLVTH